MTTPPLIDPTLPGRSRVLIEKVTPEVDGGRYPIKRVPGEKVVVEADVFADGHDLVDAALCFRLPGSRTWLEARMTPLGNDRWRAEFLVSDLGEGVYTVEGWVDSFRSWVRDTQKKRNAGQDVGVELGEAVRLVRAAEARAQGEEALRLKEWAAQLETGDTESRLAVAFGQELARTMQRWPAREHATRYPRELPIRVDALRARFSAWYELFPRSCPGRRGRHGTFRDVEGQLPRLAELGFDVLYFPPIHPIGRSFRKGRNNRTECEAEDVGSPWGIGAQEGGHKSIHPELGTLEDFRRLVQRARERGIEVALDLAYQCSPDHPYVTEHPDWFKQRADGSIQYAENPPKKYQDIYPIHFETEDWRNLWIELRSVVDYWIGHGVRIFRVDNPHTKALRFWEWLIRETQRAHPEVLFLSEAFTRPKLMYALAKVGFSQSYNYFPWRNTRYELTEYLTELTQSDVREYFRPNLWPNTPDILPQYLQFGGRPAFMARFILAATLGSSYGIYGPAFELCVAQPREPGSEEYLDSEKYELKTWDLTAPGNLSDLMGRVNRIRRENPALQTMEGLRFHPVDNEQLIAYTRFSADGANVLLVVVNLDPHHTQRGWLELPVEELKLPVGRSYQMHDLLSGARYLWSGPRNYVELDPQFVPGHLFRLRQHVRSEHDFDYYL